jgi:hypothetical protein
MLKALGRAGQVYAWRASDGRLIGLYVPGSFTDYASFPPFAETAEERAHLAHAYKVAAPERERATKAHLTDYALPLQIVVLNRDPGSYVRPHYHLNDHPAESATRHQILVCQRGRTSEIFAWTPTPCASRRDHSAVNVRAARPPRSPINAVFGGES